MATELCYYVGCERELREDEEERLRWLLAPAPAPASAPSATSRLPLEGVWEFGPR